MNVEWFTNEKDKIATIYETNITFNTVAANYFKNAYSTLIGFDIEENWYRQNGSNVLISLFC